MSKEVHRIYFCKDGAILDTQIREGEDVTDTLKRCFKKIADLEAKLAVSENTITNLVEDNRASQEWYKKQLADKEKEIENIKLCRCVNCTNEYEFMLEGLVEDLEKQIDKDDQDKISFAVEQLTQFEQEVLNYVDKVYGGIEDILDKEDLDYILNNQINKIKGNEDE